MFMLCSRLSEIFHQPCHSPCPVTYLVLDVGSEFGEGAVVSFGLEYRVVSEALSSPSLFYYLSTDNTNSFSVILPLPSSFNINAIAVRNLALRLLFSPNSPSNFVMLASLSCPSPPA